MVALNTIRRIRMPMTTTPTVVNLAKSEMEGGGSGSVEAIGGRNCALNFVELGGRVQE